MTFRLCSLRTGYGFTVEDNPEDVVVLRLAKSETVYAVGRDGVCPPALLASLREIVQDPDADEITNQLILLDTLGDMLQAKLAAIEAPVEAGDDVRPDVRENIERYRQGALRGYGGHADGHRPSRRAPGRNSTSGRAIPNRPRCRACSRSRRGT